MILRCLVSRELSPSSVIAFILLLACGLYFKMEKMLVMLQYHGIIWYCTLYGTIYGGFLKDAN